MLISEKIYQLQKNGSSLSQEKIKELKDKTEHYIKKDYSLEDVMAEFGQQFKDITEEFLGDDHQIVSGIQASINIFGKQDYSLNIIGGKTNFFTSAPKVEETTVVDIASITKFFAGLLVLKLIDEKILSWEDQVGTLCPEFSGLKNYTIKDIMRMAGQIRTDGKLSDFHNPADIYRVLKTVIIQKQDSSIYEYTDIGMMALTYTIESVFKKNGIDKSYDEILQQYLLSPLGLTNTSYLPNKDSIMGNGDNSNLPHDPKARGLIHPVGHAGLFTNSADLYQLSKILLTTDTFTQEQKRLFDQIINEQSNKGNFGAFIRHPLGLEKTYVPNEFSTDTFAYEGYTGSVYVLDLQNHIDNHFLVNAIQLEDNKKSPDYRTAIKNYQTQITDISLKLLLMSNFFEEEAKEEKGFVKKMIL